MELVNDYWFIERELFFPKSVFPCTKGAEKWGGGIDTKNMVAVRNKA